MKLRWYQDEAVAAMNNCKGNGVVTLPTGSGKSLVIREFCRNFPGGILVLSHIKEILEQNFNCLKGVEDIGLYSAGLGVKHVNRITVAGIQSVWRRPDLFRHVDMVLIDECHMISNEGMYKSLLDALGVPYIGLTATPYRLKQGYIFGPDGMFDSEIYSANINRLLREGHLCRLINYSDKECFDLEGVRTTGGDFNLGDMSLKFNREEVTRRIVKSLEVYKDTRKHWLIFCIDIEHAEHVAQLLNEAGITTAAVHSKSPRDQALLDFKAGKVQCVTNVNVLTIGFDFPSIDFIAVLRPTKSLTLHVQMLGRGLRNADGKENCLIKDFSGNIQRLGTITDLRVDANGKVSKGKGEQKFLKTCPDCDKLCSPALRKCECGHEFNFKHNLSLQAFKEKKLPQWYDVSGCMFNLHKKPGMPASVKVTYICGSRLFTEWVTPMHAGYAGYKGKSWVQRRYKGPLPIPQEASDIIKAQQHFWIPARIMVDENTKYPKIIKVV